MGLFSQTFPLMKDEAARPLVCVMSIAVFELWRTPETMWTKRKKSLAAFKQFLSTVLTVARHTGGRLETSIQISIYILTTTHIVSEGDKRGKNWVGNDRMRVGRIEFHGLPPKGQEIPCATNCTKG